MSERQGWIYKLVNTVTQEAYVGQTEKEKLKDRMSGHKGESTHR